jgi:predicted amidohydrolase YtcJ
MVTSAGHCCQPHPELAGRVQLRRVPEGPRSRRAAAPVPTMEGHADLLVVGAIVTMDPTQPEAEAMAVHGGRIRALGTRQELDGLRGPGTELLDLGDRVAMPGMVEPHMHLWTSVLFDTAVDCSPFNNRSLDDVVARLRGAATGLAPGEWLIGQLFDPSLFPGQPDLTCEILDRVAPDHPVAVMNASMHFLYVNSKAFELVGIDDQTPDPPGGVFQRRDGHLTGVVGEMAAESRIIDAIPKLSHDDLVAGLRRIMERAAAVGITKVHEAATGGVFGTVELDLLHHLQSDRPLPVRITAALLDQVRAKWEQAGIEPGAGDDMVRAISRKMISDGSNQGYSGFLREPYLGTDGRGAANLTEEELVEAIGDAHRHGWQAMVHANGDAAIDRVVAAYGAVLGEERGNGGPSTDLRHRIEHCSLARPEHLEAMAALGVSPSFLMNHLYYWGRVFRDDIFGPERALLLDPVASAVRHGLRPSFHSDYSVSPLGALRHVQTAVTRKLYDGGEVLNPAECVDVDTALRGVTIDAAWQTHTDTQLGSLTVGKYADLAILSDDPRRVDPDEIAGITVSETRLAGVTAWSQ